MATLSFKPGDSFILNTAQGKEYDGAIFPRGIYEIKAYGAKGGNGSCGGIGGNGGYAYGTLTLYEEKKLEFYIGTMGGTPKGGGKVRPGYGVPANAYSYGGNGGNDYNQGGVEYGGGGGGSTEVHIMDPPNFTSGRILFTVGGGGGAGGWHQSYNSAIAGDPGGRHASESSYYYAVNYFSSGRGKDGAVTDQYNSGEGGGGAGDPGGGIKNRWYRIESPGGWQGSGGFGGRTSIYNTYGSKYELHDIGYEIGVNNGHGYIIVKFLDYISYNIYQTNCTANKNTAKAGESITANAHISRQVRGYQVNDSIGIFTGWGYSNNISNPIISGTNIRFTMPEDNVSIWANYIRYIISCSNCWCNAPYVPIPGETYTITANPEINGYPFTHFVIPNGLKVTYLSRLQITFVMPSGNINFAAMFFQRKNTNVYETIDEYDTLNVENKV